MTDDTPSRRATDIANVAEFTDVMGALSRVTLREQKRTKWLAAFLIFDIALTFAVVRGQMNQDTVIRQNKAIAAAVSANVHNQAVGLCNQSNGFKSADRELWDTIFGFTTPNTPTAMSELNQIKALVAAHDVLRDCSKL